jgi:transposase
MLGGWTIKRVSPPVKGYPARSISHALSHVQSGGSAAYLLAVFELIACKEARFTIASSSPCTPTSTCYKLLEIERLGIAKAGNRHIRAMAIEIAWAWRRFQPASALAQWYERRFGAGSARLRKLGIVALARKLLIALWRFVKTGVLPEGAVLKTATASR